MKGISQIMRDEAQYFVARLNRALTSIVKTRVVDGECRPPCELQRERKIGGRETPWPRREEEDGAEYSSLRDEGNTQDRPRTELADESEVLCSLRERLHIVARGVREELWLPGLQNG